MRVGCAGSQMGHPSAHWSHPLQRSFILSSESTQYWECNCQSDSWKVRQGSFLKSPYMWMPHQKTYHRVIEGFGLEVILKVMKFQPHCRGRGYSYTAAEYYLSWITPCVPGIFFSFYTVHCLFFVQISLANRSGQCSFPFITFWGTQTCLNKSICNRVFLWSYLLWKFNLDLLHLSVLFSLFCEGPCTF